MRFELGKYYRHTDGETIHIIGAVNTWAYGWCFIAENPWTSELKPVGYTDDTYAQNWEEVTVHDYLRGSSRKEPPETSKEVKND